MSGSGCSLDYLRDGAVRHDRAALVVLDELESIVATLPRDNAGLRLHAIPALTALLAPGGAIAAIAAAHAGDGAKPVRAILFDKTPGTNWALGWHQDRTIAVRTRVDTAGFGPWTRKSGIQHVEPPFAIIEAMTTLRIHLDAVPVDNAPLLIAPGSHRLGRIAEGDIATTVARCGTATCLADRGDVWAYATPILHASAAATGHAHRRVLQIDYSGTALPAPLDWLGV